MKTLLSFFKASLFILAFTLLLFTTDETTHGLNFTRIWSLLETDDYTDLLFATESGLKDFILSNGYDTSDPHPSSDHEILTSNTNNLDPILDATNEEYWGIVGVNPAEDSISNLELDTVVDTNIIPDDLVLSQSARRNLGPVWWDTHVDGDPYYIAANLNGIHGWVLARDEAMIYQQPAYGMHTRPAAPAVIGDTESHVPAISIVIDEVANEEALMQPAKELLTMEGMDKDLVEPSIDNQMVMEDLDDLLSKAASDDDQSDSKIQEYGASSVPEPSTLLLMATGLAGLGIASRKKKQT